MLKNKLLKNNLIAMLVCLICLSLVTTRSALADDTKTPADVAKNNQNAVIAIGAGSVIVLVLAIALTSKSSSSRSYSYTTTTSRPVMAAAEYQIPNAVATAAAVTADSDDSKNHFNFRGVDVAYDSATQSTYMTMRGTF